MKYDKDCIFCKIVKGEIPCSKIYENDKVLAFLDIAPITKGHTLVIPKEHHKNLLELPNELLREVISAAKRVALAVRKAMKADGFNLNQSNFPAAGQVVMHAHFHIIPRYKDDGLKHWPGGKYKEGEAEKIREEIVKALG